ACDRLGITEIPAPAPAAQPTQTDLSASPALSIQLTPANNFKGRIVGVMISDGFDGALLKALEQAVADAGAVLRVVAPRIGGATCSKGDLHPVTDQIGGAPSVLFDAVAIIPGDDNLASSPAAIDFLNDAYVHCKFIGVSAAVDDLLDACGLSRDDDDGIFALTDAVSASDLLDACRSLRVWEREDQFTA
ncbi:MAG: catalase HPII, partial [Loktanella sp.]|nr:catalase HPII [Loktanella sp.]